VVSNAEGCITGGAEYFSSWGKGGEKSVGSVLSVRVTTLMTIYSRLHYSRIRYSTKWWG
jgi:hypothetical protein